MFSTAFTRDRRFCVSIRQTLLRLDERNSAESAEHERVGLWLRHRRPEGNGVSRPLKYRFHRAVA